MKPPSDPASPEGAAPEDPPAPAAPAPGEGASVEGPPERYGPLLLSRYRKDDGRTLILYAEDEEGGVAAHG